MKPALREEVKVVLDRIDPESQWDQDTADVIDQLVKENEELLEALTDVIWQACADGGTLDSMALSAYADGMRTLADHQVISIQEEHGRRVIAIQSGTKQT